MKRIYSFSTFPMIEMMNVSSSLYPYFIEYIYSVYIIDIIIYSSTLVYIKQCILPRKENSYFLNNTGGNMHKLKHFFYLV